MAWLPRWLTDVFRDSVDDKSLLLPSTASTSVGEGLRSGRNNKGQTKKQHQDNHRGRPPVLTDDPWESWYTCTNIDAWRAWIAERGLSPLSWIVMPDNADECTPGHMYIECSPLRWCLEVLDDPVVRRAALAAWLDAGARPEDDMFRTETFDTWPPGASVHQGPGKRGTVEPLWYLAKSTEEEDLLRAYAPSGWGLETPANIQALNALKAIDIDDWGVEREPRYNPAWMTARSSTWMEDMLSMTEPGLGQVGHAVRLRMWMASDPQIHAGTVKLLEKFPNIVTASTWKKWWMSISHQYQVLLSPEEEIARIQASLRGRIDEMTDIFYDFDIVSSKTQPQPRFTDKRVSITPASPSAIFDGMVTLGRAMARNNPEWMEGIVSALVSTAPSQIPKKNWETMGKMLSTIFGPEQDWSLLTTGLVQKPEASLVRLAMAWGLPADTLLPNGASLLHRWLSETEVPEQAAIDLIEAGCTGKPDATTLDAYQWYTSLERMERAGAISGDLRQRLHVLHERLALEDIIASADPVTDSPRPRKARL